jgi:hypothetical protein
MSSGCVFYGLARLFKLKPPKLLPDEVALLVFSFLPWEDILSCSCVNRQWRSLAGDSSVWRALCNEQNWRWRSWVPSKIPANSHPGFGDSEDEGMGDEDEDDAVERMLLDDSGFSSMAMDAIQPSGSNSRMVKAWLSQLHHSKSSRMRKSLSSLRSQHVSATMKPNYKLLFATHIRLRDRFVSAQYTRSTLQNRGSPNGHTNTIYCLQLYTYPDTGLQVLFTGSKDRTIREWDLSTGTVRRVIKGIHEGSVLSICAYNGLLASGGSDKTVVMWSLASGQPIRVIRDHQDSVLCVRFNDKRLVSCSKGQLFYSIFPTVLMKGCRSDHPNISPTELHIPVPSRAAPRRC